MNHLFNMTPKYMTLSDTFSFLGIQCHGVIHGGVYVEHTPHMTPNDTGTKPV